MLNRVRHAPFLAAIPALLIALAVFAAAHIGRTGVTHAEGAIQEQQRLLTGMLDQETGARGYFQTRDESFLQPWYAGSTDFSQALAAASVTDSGDTGLLRDLGAEAMRAAAWHANTAAAIADAQRSGRLPSVAQALVRKTLMDAFRASDTTFAHDLVQRRDRALSQATLLEVGLSGVVAVTIALAGFALMSRAAARDRRRRGRETELRELLQVSESEGESRSLLIRYIERSVPGTGAAVLNRNNSDDRLEPSLGCGGTPLTALPTDDLQPRSCLAVRLSRPHERGRGQQPLASCEVCGKLAAEVTCEPLLVGGQVIGSVLVASKRQMRPGARATIRDAVIQAAPIIANQRNLAVAKTRAARDALTGLDNRRSADDTLKRMAAQASRTVSPLSALLIDLDHFKQINDAHGHERGDEALATVGGILTSNLRASDFAARYGGEEFLVLLPDTGPDQATIVAEQLRLAIAQADLRAGRMTASIGVATIPDDAADPEHLLRKADRALYTAKQNGRNRVELASGMAAADELEVPA